MVEADRPLIAIPARFSATASALRFAADVSARQLIEAVFAAGGEPLMVHPHAPDGRVADRDVARRLSWAEGVLLPGGGDLSSRWFGQPPDPSLYDVDEEQDAFDLSVARFALTEGVPLLSICRGTQVVNVALGGTLIQDMDSHGSPISHHRNHLHHVTVDEDARLRGIVGESVEVSCYHHQCIDRLGEGLVVRARSEEGVVEAVELANHHGFFLGVQWHPEDTWRTSAEQLGVFRALVKEAAAQRV